ncbi:synaptic vesicle transporter [Aulographum hederae CBS 113979]|uniref:Synaptic vesicle transporter n=1 Tax=Aulographum hederae CBS 113979 TaxID=1176131 RepID=A0A6G1GL50_9PEZI|nr:synaptic vesicle transporter [Aulographum hederae CBS 113979]
MFENVEIEKIQSLTEEHREYLLQRHGTLDLDPLPSKDPADPLNWPSWTKLANLLTVSFLCLSGGFISAGVIPANEMIAESLQITLQQASYVASIQIIMFGWSPFFWTPISKRYGRRPVWLGGVFVSLICNIGSALSKTYGQLIACRAIGGFFIGAAIGMGSATVVETYFSRERGKYMGIWTSLTTIGPPLGGLSMGFVAQHLDYTWIFWICAIMNAVQLVAHLLLTPETLYNRDSPPTLSPLRNQYLSLRRHNPTPFTFTDLLRPFTLSLTNPTIFLPALAYGLTFTLVVFSLVELPQIFIPAFHLTPQALGLNFIGVLVGTLIGEQAAGPLSDWWIRRRHAKIGRQPQPEYRLWLSYIGFVLAILGLVLFCLLTQHLAGAAEPTYNVSPIVGQAISGVGNQIVGTVLVTYAVDCHREDSAEVGAFVNMIRMTLGFAGPFVWPDMIEGVGLGGTAGVIGGIIAGLGIGGVVVLQVLGVGRR